MEIIKRMAKILIAAIALAVFLPMADVKAEQYIEKDTFDYNWYLEKHPDLSALVSADDYDTIWAFYESTGKLNGWPGRRTKESYMGKWDFDYEAFLEKNPDVSAAFGYDYDGIYDWYVTTGISENRQGFFTEEAVAMMKIYDIAENITNPDMSETEKIKAVHDWLCINVEYEHENFDYAWGSVWDVSYFVEGAINHGKAKCNGYALAFAAFMDVLGIENEYVAGWSDTSGHAWNKVKVDGNWYEIDVTWDDLDLTWDDLDPDFQGYRYDYFLISEEQMNEDHGIYVRV